MSIYEYRPLLIYGIFLAGCLGACNGSFLNCAAWRITHGESFLSGRSHCTSCGHELGVLELIPVFGWIILKGRCRHCGEKIPFRYPLTELSFALITILCLLQFDLTLLGLRNYIFLCLLFLLTLTDIDAMIIPDGCHIIAILVWIAFAPFLLQGWADLGFHLLAMLVYGGGLLLVSLIMDRVLGRESLGGGDIKLFGVIGLYMGMIGTLFVMITACLTGLIFQIVIRRKSEEKAFPFGPWIALAAAVIMLYGGPLISWYQGMLI